MRNIRFSEYKIIIILAFLKSVEAVGTVKYVCRETAVSEASYYNREANKIYRNGSDNIKKTKNLNTTIVA